MSEEFSLTVKLKPTSEKLLVFIRKLEDLFDQGSYLAIEKAFTESGIELKGGVNELVSSISSAQSEFLAFFDGDILKALSESSVENKPQLEIVMGENITLEIEGADHSADDFCTFFVALMFLSGVTELSARARSSFWRGAWALESEELVGKVVMKEC